ncbi:MAG TPA: YHS domain-containing protein [Bryobacteraceae bacterium]|jgi:YHS domain-containing protein|nr:YHS domain-containing protein [Bryobacteraceae bacterium]
MRFLFRIVIVPLLLFWLVRTILRSILAGVNTQVAAKPARQAPTVSTGGELKKDPVCGTYVSEDTAVTKRINGQTIHFCSPGCRDKYRAAS